VAPDRKLLPELASFIAALRARDLDAATLDAVKLHGFDALGSACAGAATSEIGITRDALLRAAFLSPPKSILDHPGCAAAILVTACRLTKLGRLPRGAGRWVYHQGLARRDP
jgi:2-methylcitrate dehydratase PrpD